MILTVLLLVPLVGCLAVGLLPRSLDAAARWVALLFSLGALGVAVAVLARFNLHQPGYQLVVDKTWVSAIGAQYHLGVDGVSVFLVLLSAVLTPLAIVGSWNVADRARSHFALILFLEITMFGVFLSLDLLLFYVFWEVLLVPGYFLIGGWGRERRVYAAVKFFLYTLLGGLFMLVGIIALYYINTHSGGAPSFELATFQALHFAPATERLLFLAFFAAFAIKIPLFPLHTWQPDAYTEAPTGTTVLFAGVLSKMGAYGFIRFSLGMFPSASHYFQPLLLTLAVISILYGAVVAIMQKDVKRLVAYSSLSHMGFIVLGIFAFTLQGVQGAVFYMLAHGVVIGGLFFLVGMLEDRRATTRIDAFGGLQKVVPRMAGVMLVLVLGAVALPGLVGFVGEFLTLLGTFLVHRWYAIVASVGVILSVVYMLWAYRRMWQGGEVSEENRRLRDLDWREWAILAPLLAAILVLGMYPRPVLQRITPAAVNVVAGTARPAIGLTGRVERTTGSSPADAAGPTGSPGTAGPTGGGP